MPVEVRIHGSSRVPVSVHDNSTEIRAKTNNNIENSRLEHLIEKETEERKEADIQLQQQLDAKENKVEYITIPSSRGILTEDELNLLVSSRLNQIIYSDNYYRLATKDNRYWRFIGDTLDPNRINTIVIDTVTGEYIYSAIGNVELQNHMDDDVRHINEGEREFWNNKLNLDINGETLQLNRN